MSNQMFPDTGDFILVMGGASSCIGVCHVEHPESTAFTIKLGRGKTREIQVSDTTPEYRVVTRAKMEAVCNDLRRQLDAKGVDLLGTDDLVGLQRKLQATLPVRPALKADEELERLARVAANSVLGIDTNRWPIVRWVLFGP